jgi:hypothetical protein
VVSAESAVQARGGVAGGVPGGVVGGAGGGRGGRGGPPPPAAAPAPPSAFNAQQERIMADAPSRRLSGALGESETGGATINVVEAAATRVEEFYEYTFPFAVRIGSRQSALLPFLQKTLSAEKLSIFNANTDRGNPRLGARLENSTDLPLEAGPVTFFQDSRYTGEAVLDYLPRGVKALVSFGVDHDIQIARRQQAQPETTSRITISKGIAVLFHESVLNTTYEIRNKGQDSKTLVIEHPRVGDRTLKGLEPFERTEGFHRFRIALDPQQETTFPVAEVVARRTTLSLQSLTRPQLTLFAGAATPPDVRRRLGQIVDLQERVSTLTSEVQATQASIDTLFRDQERLRENLKALGTGSQDQEMRSRYLDQLRRQEDQIDAARTRIDAANAEIGTTQAQLSELISTFAFGE